MRSIWIATLLLGISAWLAAPATTALGENDPKGAKADAAKDKAKDKDKAKSPDAAKKDKSHESHDAAKDKSHESKEARHGHHCPWGRGMHGWAFHHGGPWGGFGPGFGGPAWGGRGHGWCPCPFCQRSWHGPGMGGPGWGGWGPMGGWGRPGMHGPGFGFRGWHGGPEGRTAMKMPSAEELFKLFDKDGNGSISKEEFTDGLKRIQERFHERMRAGFGPGRGPEAGGPSMHGPAEGRMSPMGRGPMGPGRGPMGFGPGPMGRGPEAGPPRGMPKVSDLFDRFDKNKDGKLTKEEVPAPLWERMSKADTNNDGAVTKDELEAAHKKMRERFEQMRKEGPAKEKKQAPEKK